jgi:hypothetical protein
VTSPNVIVAGTLKDGALSLAGSGSWGSMTLNLAKVDDSELASRVSAFRDKVDGVSRAAAEADEEQQREKAKADQLTNIQNLTQRIANSSTKMEAEVPKFRPTEERLRAITAQMREQFNRQPSIFGGGQAALARGQLSLAMNQSAMDANQIHLRVQAARQQFNVEYSELLRGAESVEGVCNWGTSTPEIVAQPRPTAKERLDAILNNRPMQPATAADPVVSNETPLRSACVRFVDAYNIFRDRAASLRAAFKEIDEVWASERGDQDMILRKSRLTIR